MLIEKCVQYKDNHDKVKDTRQYVKKSLHRKIGKRRSASRTLFSDSDLTEFESEEENSGQRVSEVSSRSSHSEDEVHQVGMITRSKAGSLSPLVTLKIRRVYLLALAEGLQIWPLAAAQSRVQERNPHDAPSSLRRAKRNGDGFETSTPKKGRTTAVDAALSLPSLGVAETSNVVNDTFAMLPSARRDRSITFMDFGLNSLTRSENSGRLNEAIDPLVLKSKTPSFATETENTHLAGLEILTPLYSCMEFPIKHEKN